MPYIQKDRRGKITQLVKKLKAEICSEGEMNFAITKLVEPKVVRYCVLNKIIGVLECVKLELYRRVAAKYEDKKCEENGDVYSQRC